MSIVTRVGHIGDTDNRFLGRSVFEELSREVVDPGHAIGLALGAEALDADDREALRLVMLCLLSPDARVWPVKLTRVLSSYGDPVAGFYGAQLIAAGVIMGPGTAVGCASGLRFVTEQVADGATVDRAVARWLERCGGRFGGFGVPFRPQDERLLALRRFVAETPLAARPFWRLQEQVAGAMAPLEPNVVLGLSALLLDVGIPAGRCGVAVSLMMTPVFVAHALEAAHTDGALQALPPSAVDYQGVPPRDSTRPGGAGDVHPALRRHQPASTGGNTYGG